MKTLKVSLLLQCKRNTFVLANLTKKYKNKLEDAKPLEAVYVKSLKQN